MTWAIEARDSYVLGLSPQSIRKSILGWLCIEGRIFLSKRNSIPSIFNVLVQEIRASYRRGIFEWAQHRISLPIKIKFQRPGSIFLVWWNSRKVTLVWPRVGKTLNTKIATFWYIRYILCLEMYHELKIVEAKDKILMYTMSKIQPYIHHILEDMIPLS